MKPTSCQEPTGPGEPHDLLTIGDLSRRTGKAASAIRYYEKVGLLTEVTRVGGRRRYPAASVRTLAVIETGQRAGLSLGEIRELLDAASAGEPTPGDRLRGLAERKLPEVDALLERVTVVRRWLELAAGCACPTLADCPLFDDPSPLPARPAG